MKHPGYIIGNIVIFTPTYVAVPTQQGEIVAALYEKDYWIYKIKSFDGGPYEVQKKDIHKFLK